MLRVIEYFAKSLKIIRANPGPTAAEREATT